MICLGWQRGSAGVQGRFEHVDANRGGFVWLVQGLSVRTVRLLQGHFLPRLDLQQGRTEWVQIWNFDQMESAFKQSGSQSPRKSLIWANWAKMCMQLAWHKSPASCIHWNYSRILNFRQFLRHVRNCERLDGRAGHRHRDADVEERHPQQPPATHLQTASLQQRQLCSNLFLTFQFIF